MIYYQSVMKKFYQVIKLEYMDLRGILQDLAKDLLGDQKMSDDDFEKIYEMIEDKVDNEPPPRFAFIGETGVGKSSTLMHYLTQVWKSVIQRLVLKQQEGLKFLLMNFGE